MGEDFKDALARIQSDYEFYIQCQLDPQVALIGYSLTSEEREALADPEALTAALTRGADLLRPSITIKISGTHDWVNAAPQKESETDELAIASQVEAVKAARSEEQREESTLHLIQLMG